MIVDVIDIAVIWAAAAGCAYVLIDYWGDL